MNATMTLSSFLNRQLVLDVLQARSAAIVRAYRLERVGLWALATVLVLALLLRVATTMLGFELPSDLSIRYGQGLTTLLTQHAAAFFLLYLAVLLWRPDIGVVAPQAFAWVWITALVYEVNPLKFGDAVGAGMAALMLIISQRYLMKLVQYAYAPVWRLWDMYGPAAHGDRDSRDASIRGVGGDSEVASTSDFVRNVAVTPVETEYTNRARPARFRFDDLHGMFEAKAQIAQAASEILGDPNAPSRSALQTKGGIYLHGPPGNGKSSIAEALAGQIGIPFMLISLKDVQSKWIGEPTQRLMRAIEDARAQAPCVLLLDEIDRLARDRSSENLTNEAGDMSAALLPAIDSLRGSGVILMAATNYPQAVDPAVRREGRFDYWITIGHPDLAARVGFILDAMEQHAPSAQIDLDEVRLVAKRLSETSTTRIKAIAEQSAKLACKTGRLDRFIIDRAAKTSRRDAGLDLGNTPGLESLVLSARLKTQVDGLVARMRDPIGIESQGGSLPSGILLMGPPGTGKTKLVSAIAKEVGWAVFETSGTKLAHDPREIETILERARNARPAMIFVDEASDLLSSRAGSGYSAATNKLLVAMDGLAVDKSDLIWVAALNDWSNLDAACVRGGRFEMKIETELPDADQRAALIKRCAAAKGWTVSDPRRSAVFTAGCSHADIAAVVQAAINAAISLHGADRSDWQISSTDLQSALRTVRL